MSICFGWFLKKRAQTSLTLLRKNKNKNKKDVKKYDVWEGHVIHTVRFNDIKQDLVVGGRQGRAGQRAKR